MPAVSPLPRCQSDKKPPAACAEANGSAASERDKPSSMAGQAVRMGQAASSPPIISQVKINAESCRLNHVSSGRLCEWVTGWSKERRRRGESGKSCKKASQFSGSVICASALSSANNASVSIKPPMMATLPRSMALPRSVAGTGRCRAPLCALVRAAQMDRLHGWCLTIVMRFITLIIAES